MRFSKNAQCEKWGYCIPHEPHYWDKRLFKRKHCSGFKKLDPDSLGLFKTPQEIDTWIAETFAPPRHRHFFKVDPIHTDFAWISWRCHGCQEERSTPRWHYLVETIKIVPNVGLYIEAWMRSDEERDRWPQ